MGDPLHASRGVWENVVGTQHLISNLDISSGLSVVT